MPEGGANLRIKVRPLGTFGVDLKQSRKVMGAAAREVAREAKSILRSGSGGGRVYLNSGGNRYKPVIRGKHQASAPGQPPATQTGFLSNQLAGVAFKSGQGFAVRDRAFYSAALEKGALGGSKGKPRTLAARPYLSVALNRKWPSISKKIIDALRNGVTYKPDRRSR